MKSFALSFIFYFTLCCHFGYGQTADKRLTGLDEELEKIRKEFNTPGFSVAVVEKGKIIYMKGFGFRELENKIPVTPNTLFMVGSCSKAFTAAIIGKLENQGKFRYDDPAHNVLPALSFYNDDLNKNITIRDMLSHRTGLLRYDRSWVLFNSGPRDSFVHRIQWIDLLASPREKFVYNNMMYISLGALAEKITGRTWEAQVKEDLFTPLRMASSTVLLEDYKNGSDRSLGYRTNSSGESSAINYYYDTQLAAPAAGVISNATDMAHWLMAWLNSGKYEGVQVLPVSFVKEAFTSQIQVLSSLPAADKPDIHFSGYGFAWQVNSYRGHYRAEHGGRVEGFTAQALLYPTDSIGIIVLSNQTSSFLPQAVGNIIADKLFNLTPYDWVSDMKKATANFYARRNQKKVEYPDVPASLPINQYSGEYFHGAFGKIHVSSSNDSLFASIGDFRFWVKHLSADAFEFFLVEPGNRVINTSDNRPGRQLVKFYLSKTGESESLDIDLDPETKPILFTRRRPASTR